MLRIGSVVGVSVVVVAVLGHLHQLRTQDLVVLDAAAQSFEGPQVLDRLRSHFSEHYVSQVEEGRRGEGDQEPTVVGVLLAHAAQQSRPVVGQLEGLVSEGRPEDGAVASGEVSQFGVGARNGVVEVVADEGEGATLVGGSAQQQTLEVLGSAGDGVFEELIGAWGTRKCRSKSFSRSEPMETEMMGLVLFWIWKLETGV